MEHSLLKWFERNGQGIIDLLDTLDDTNGLMVTEPAFAASHRAWKRERAEQKRKLEGAARRLEAQRHGI